MKPTKSKGLAWKLIKGFSVSTSLGLNLDSILNTNLLQFIKLIKFITKMFFLDVRGLK